MKKLAKLECKMEEAKIFSILVTIAGIVCAALSCWPWTIIIIPACCVLFFWFIETAANYLRSECNDITRNLRKVCKKGGHEYGYVDWDDNDQTATRECELCGSQSKDSFSYDEYFTLRLYVRLNGGDYQGCGYNDAVAAVSKQVVADTKKRIRADVKRLNCDCAIYSKEGGWCGSAAGAVENHGREQVAHVLSQQYCDKDSKFITRDVCEYAYKLFVKKLTALGLCYKAE